jgi:hypothetical protein
MMKDKVILVVPEAPVPAAAAGMQKRKFAQGGLRLGVLDNSKGNADHLLKFVVDGVKSQVAVKSVVLLRKASVSLPAPDAILDQLVAQTDFVVSAMAD